MKPDCCKDRRPGSCTGPAQARCSTPAHCSCTAFQVAMNLPCRRRPRRAPPCCPRRRGRSRSPLGPARQRQTARCWTPTGGFEHRELPGASAVAHAVWWHTLISKRMRNNRRAQQCPAAVGADMPAADFSLACIRLTHVSHLHRESLLRQRTRSVEPPRLRGLSVDPPPDTRLLPSSDGVTSLFRLL